MKYTILLGGLLGLFSTLLFAGDGHDHDHHDHGHDHGDHPEDTHSVQNGHAPQRLPDGRLFLPKPTQHFLQLRTQVTQIESAARSHYLNARIVSSANAIGTVQALQAGHLRFTETDLPLVGDRLKKGQLLATITLARDAQEDTRQHADVAEARERLRLAQQELRRLQKLGQLIPQQEVDQAAAEVRRLKALMAALNKGTVTQEKLYVPMDGVVTQVYAQIGQSVQAGERILELLDVSRLQVEALSYDPLQAKHIKTADLLLENQVIPLRYHGTNRQLQQQALPLRFIAKDKKALADLALGFVAQVRIRDDNTLKGIILPVEALARNPSNQFIVWVKTEAEHFSPRTIQYQNLDSQHMMVTAGLAAGERVVVQATTLINQIR